MLCTHTSRPKGCSQPRELWFFDILMYKAAEHCSLMVGVLHHAENGQPSITQLHLLFCTHVKQPE